MLRDFCQRISWKIAKGNLSGKISHPYRVWKVYKHRFSENIELAIGRTLIRLKRSLFFVL